VSPLGLGRADVVPRIVKRPAAFKRSRRDTSGNGCSLDPCSETVLVLESFLDLLLPALIHSTTLKYRSRNLVVIFVTVHKNDYLLTPSPRLRTLLRWLFHSSNSVSYPRSVHSRQTPCQGETVKRKEARSPRATSGLLFVGGFGYKWVNEFFEARVAPKRIEHRIKPEQSRGERQVFRQWTGIRY